VLLSHNLLASCLLIFWFAVLLSHNLLAPCPPVC
jgi:hypothetical protein